MKSWGEWHWQMQARTLTPQLKKEQIFVRPSLNMSHSPKFSGWSLSQDIARAHRTVIGKKTLHWECCMWCSKMSKYFNTYAAAFTFLLQGIIYPQGQFFSSKTLLKMNEKQNNFPLEFLSNCHFFRLWTFTSDSRLKLCGHPCGDKCKPGSDWAWFVVLPVPTNLFSVSVSNRRQKHSLG